MGTADRCHKGPEGPGQLQLWRSTPGPLLIPLMAQWRTQDPACHVFSWCIHILDFRNGTKKKKKEVGLQEVRSGWRESRICTLIQLKALGQTGKQACPVISLSLRSHTCTAEGQASTEVRGRRWAWVGTGVGTCTARSKDHKSCISVSCAYGISKGLLPTTCGAPTLLSSKSKF